VSQRFHDFLANFAKRSGGTHLPAPRKNLVRVVEKIELQADAEQRTCFSKSVDITRGALKYGDTGRLVQALQLLMACDREEAAASELTSELLGLGGEDIVIVRVKDRFAKPNASGYADALVNAYFADDPNQHVFEIQLMHDSLYTVRKEQGAHSLYNRARTAIEILETLRLGNLIPEVPPEEAAPTPPSRSISAASADSDLTEAVRNLSGKVAEQAEQLGNLAVGALEGPESANRASELERLHAEGDSLAETVRAIAVTVEKQGAEIRALQTTMASVLQDVAELKQGRPAQAQADLP